MSKSSLIENKNQLLEYLTSGMSTDKSTWRIGAEHEKFVFHRADGKPLAYEGTDGRPGIKDVLMAFEQHGWDPVNENGNVIAEAKGGASITLEPGGQFELSGATLETIHQTCDETSRHLRQAKAIGEDLDIGFLGVGFHPTEKREDIPVMPKERYNIMRNYMPKVGTMGLDMMLRTCTVQVNLDFADEADMVEKFRIGLALQPIATALFANSPFTEGKPNGFKSKRSNVWTDTDGDRCGMLPFVFEDGMGFERYLDHMLDVPMYFVNRGGKYIDAAGLSFRDFMNGTLEVLPGELPTLADFEDHMTTLFPEVRLKTYMEMRGADGASWSGLCALPAIWTGLLYDNDAQQAAADLIKDWDFETLQKMRDDAPAGGLQAIAAGRTFQDIAKEVLTIADVGLKNRNCLSSTGETEQGFLDGLRESVESGKTPADRMLDAYNGPWKGDITRIFDEFSY